MPIGGNEFNPISYIFFEEGTSGTLVIPQGATKMDLYVCGPGGNGAEGGPITGGGGGGSGGEFYLPDLSITPGESIFYDLGRPTELTTVTCAFISVRCSSGNTALLGLGGVGGNGEVSGDYSVISGNAGNNASGGTEGDPGFCEIRHQIDGNVGNGGLGGGAPFGDPELGHSGGVRITFR